MVYRAEIEGRDWVEVHKSGEQYTVKASGCLDFLTKVKAIREQLKGDPSNWEVPHGGDHSNELLREVVLRAQGKWDPPYQEPELCHCRMVPTKKVHQAILCGAKDADDVARMTTAGTGCSTCRPHTEDLIRYRQGD